MSTWPDGYVNVNGIRIHYNRTGQGEKPAIIMAHGITDNGLCWSPLAHALENEYDIIMVDARGHGLSDKPESGYTYANHAADLAGMIDALGLERPIVIGHSMGGASTAYLADHYPDHVSRLILEDPGWLSSEVGTQPAPEVTEQRRREFAERLAWRQTQPLGEITADTRRLNPLWRNAEFPAHSESKLQVSPNVLQIIGTPTKPWWEIVPALQCPTLVITGEKERGAIITESQAVAITSLNPLVTVVKINGAGHNIRRDQFDTFLSEVRHFLDA